MQAANVISLGPQPGFQSTFLASGADITIGGGAAGCGKTYAEILAGARHMQVPGFAAVFFRRTTKQIRNPGGLWDEAGKVYPLLGATPDQQDNEWHWPSGAKVKMAHLEHESNIYDWQGAQVPLFIFDELTHFTAKMFWYMQSRNRSTCGVRPYVLATCNPDADSWVAELVAWWIDQDADSPTYGLPLPERAGVLRYFTRLGDVMVWGDSAQEVIDQAPGVTAIDVNSLTFVPGRLEENVILETVDPKYRGKLMAMSRVERERLLGGNWKVRAVAGDYFKRDEVKILDLLPSDILACSRGWDLAATEPSEVNKDPDWTFGVKIGRRSNGRFVVIHVAMARKRSDEVRKLVRQTAEDDGPEVSIALAQDPGQAGKDQSESYVSLLAGFPVHSEPETGSKETRADLFASQWQGGNVEVLRGRWNAEYFSQMEGFPSKGVHDDAVDASSTAFKRLAAAGNVWDNN